MQWCLEHVHVYAGTPWWASIVITGVLVRIVLSRLYINAAENGARMAIAAPLTRPMTEKLSEARQRGDTSAMLQIQSEVMRINKRAGVSMVKSFLPFVGGIATYGTFVLLRAMARLPLPSLETGGALWFPNLCIPDPYFLLPLATAGILHWVLRVRVIHCLCSTLQI
jgi:YidC/Oxa1 family membrane protein insertase